MGGASLLINLPPIPPESPPTKQVPAAGDLHSTRWPFPGLFVRRSVTLTCHRSHIPLAAFCSSMASPACLLLKLLVCKCTSKVKTEFVWEVISEKVSFHSQHTRASITASSVSWLLVFFHVLEVLGSQRVSFAPSSPRLRTGFSLWGRGQGILHLVTKLRHTLH